MKSRRRHISPDDLVLRVVGVALTRAAYVLHVRTTLTRFSLASKSITNFVIGYTLRGWFQVLGATRLVRLAQTYSEEQGRDQARINDAFEERLAVLEQRVRRVDVDADASTEAEEVKTTSQPSPLAAAATRGKGGGSYGTPLSRRSPPASHVVPPGIDEASLSHWMAGVDRQLEDLRKGAAARSPGGGVGYAVAPRPRVGGPVHEESVWPEKGEEEKDNEEHKSECGQGPERKKEEESVESGRAFAEAEAAKSAAAAAVEAVEAESARSAAAAAVAAVAAAAAAQLAEKGLARMEQRVYRLEVSLHRPANSETLVNSRSPTAAGNDRGRRPNHDAKLALGSLSRSPSRSCSRGRDQSPPPIPPAATGFPSNPESTSRTVLDAVGEGNAVARRASEVAQKALMLGKEAAERSERAGEFRQTDEVTQQRVRHQRSNVQVFGCRRFLLKIPMLYSPRQILSHRVPPFLFRCEGYAVPKSAKAA